MFTLTFREPFPPQLHAFFPIEIVLGDELSAHLIPLRCVISPEKNRLPSFLDPKHLMIGGMPTRNLELYPGADRTPVSIQEFHLVPRSQQTQFLRDIRRQSFRTGVFPFPALNIIGGLGEGERVLAQGGVFDRGSAGVVLVQVAE